MHRNNHLHILLFSLILAVSTNAMAVSATTKPAPEPPATPVALDADVNNLVFTGLVKKIPNGTALVTPKATYMLAGGNFDGIVGREVNIIGKVVKEGSIEKIDVARAQLAGP